MSDAMTMETYGITDKGKVRSNNEDQFLIAALHKMVEVEGTSLPIENREHLDGGTMARLLLVADGMGGHAAGQVASELAIEVILNYVTASMRCFFQLDRVLEKDLLRALSASVEQSHSIVQAVANKHSQYEGMATTLTLAHILWPRAYIVHVGDSRCYRRRGTELTQVTQDQTVAQELTDRGVITRPDAAAGPLDNVLFSAVGMGIKPSAFVVDLQYGDDLLLCTDGLTRHVPDRTIADMLVEADSSQDACTMLIDHALDAGGSDNVTVVVSRFR